MRGGRAGSFRGSSGRGFGTHSKAAACAPPNGSSPSSSGSTADSADELDSPGYDYFKNLDLKYRCNFFMKVLYYDVLDDLDPTHTQGWLVDCPDVPEELKRPLQPETIQRIKEDAVRRGFRKNRHFGSMFWG